MRNHGHITVNDREVNIASYQCKPGDVVAVKNRERSRTMVEANLKDPGLAHLPNHLEFDKQKLIGKVNGVIEREWIALQINELLVVDISTHGKPNLLVISRWSLVISWLLAE